VLSSAFAMVTAKLCLSGAVSTPEHPPMHSSKFCVWEGRGDVSLVHGAERAGCVHLFAVHRTLRASCDLKSEVMNCLKTHTRSNEKHVGQCVEMCSSSE
jgi:hypothetical protein